MLLRTLSCLSGLLCLFATQCGGTAPAGDVQRVTVGDTLIVTTTPSDEPRTSLYHFEPDLVIGVGEGESMDDPFMFSYIADLTVDPDGQIYALEYGDREVRIFNSSGQFLRRFGRSGQGPGEFHSGADAVQPISILQDGRVVVEDYPFSIEVFDKDGIYEQSIDLNPLNLNIHVSGRAFFPIHWLSDIGTMVIPWRYSSRQEGMVYRFLLTDESFGSVRWLPVRISYSAMYSEGSTSISLPFVGRAVWTMTGNSTIVWAKSDEYRLTCYDIGQDRWMQLVLNVEPVPVTSADIEKFKERHLSYGPASRRAVFEPLYNRAPYPKNRPFFSSLTGDDEGNIWVARDVETYLIGEPEMYHYDLFSEDGEWMGIVESPRLWEVIKDGFAYATSSAEYPVIERFRIAPHN